MIKKEFNLFRSKLMGVGLYVFLFFTSATAGINIFQAYVEYKNIKNKKEIELKYE